MRYLTAFLVTGVLTFVFARALPPALPEAGDVYEHRGTQERILIDGTGTAAELRARYHAHNARLQASLDEMGDQGVVERMIVPVGGEGDSTTLCIAFLGRETVEAGLNSVYVLDGEWYGRVPVTVAHIHSVAWLHDQYRRVD